jgi:hypothetical protein
VCPLSLDCTQYGYLTFFFGRGTFYTPVKGLDTERARLIKDTIMKAAKLKRPIKRGVPLSDLEWESRIMKKAKYSLSKLKNIMCSEMKDQGGRL